MSVSFKVEIAFSSSATGGFIIGTSLLGSDLLAGGFTWTDVTSWVHESSLTTNRGATRSHGPFFRYEAGTCSFTLDNNDGSDRFSPLNLSGPYAASGITQIRPGLPVRVQFQNTTDASTLSLWQGTIDTWDPAIDGDGFWSQVSVTATDIVEQLQASNTPALVTAVGAGETAANRIGRVMTNAGLPSTSLLADLLSTEGATMQATTLAQPAWTEMLLTADSDAGFLFADASGKINYRRRNQIATMPTLYLGGISSVNPEPPLDVSYDRQQVVNSISLARVGSTVQFVDSASSIAISKLRSYARSDLVCETDAQAQEVAQWILYQSSTLKVRIESVTLRLLKDTDSDALWWVFAQYAEITTRLSITWSSPTGQSIAQQYLVRGVSWKSLPGGNAELKLALMSTPTTSLSPFIIGTSLLGGVNQLSPF